MPATEGSANSVSGPPAFFFRAASGMPVLSPRCQPWKCIEVILAAVASIMWMFLGGKTLHATKLDSSGWRLLGGQRAFVKKMKETIFFWTWNLQIFKCFWFCVSEKSTSMLFRHPDPLSNRFRFVRKHSCANGKVDHHFPHWHGCKLGLNCPCSDKPKYHVVGTYKCLYIYIYRVYMPVIPHYPIPSSYIWWLKPPL